MVKFPIMERQDQIKFAGWIHQRKQSLFDNHWFLCILADSGFSNWRENRQSQVKQFEDFILRANKYPTLSIFGGNDNLTAVKKIILVEVLWDKLLFKCI